MLPLLSSMTVDLCCWVSVGAWGCCRPLCCFLTSFPSLCSCTAPRSTFPLLSPSFSWLLCSLFCTLVLFQCLCTSIVSSAVSGCTDPKPRLWPKVESSTSVFQGPLRLLLVALLLDCLYGYIRRCPGRRGLQTCSTYLSLEHFRYFRVSECLEIKSDARALREALGSQLQLDGCKHEVMVAANVGTWERCVCFVDAGLDASGCQDEVYLVVNLPIRGMPGCCTGQLMGWRVVALCELKVSILCRLSLQARSSYSPCLVFVYVKAYFGFPVALNYKYILLGSLC